MMSHTPIPNPLEWGGRDEWDGEERVVLLYNLYPATANIWRLADVYSVYVARLLPDSGNILFFVHM